MRKWPVIACDQFTQDRDYWEKVSIEIDGAPSTLNLIFPEVFLNDGNAESRIADIHSTMIRYLKENVLNERQGFVYIERDTPYNKKRRGLVAAIDLEKYEWKPAARPLIRCTEGTVEDRLPPRMDIRRGAPMELPHILLLIDDETDSILPAVGEIAKSRPAVYDTSLMMNCGKVTGWFLDSPSSAMTVLTEKLEELCNRSVSRCGQPFLFAVGDGNHSLAAAKGIWEEFKEKNGLAEHPCRYALVEIENIYDPAIKFEPIHRVIFGMAFDEAVSLLSTLPNFSHTLVDSFNELAVLCEQQDVANRFGIVADGRCALIKTSATGIATACLQPLLDEYLINNKVEIDYIHDIEEVFRLTEKNKKTSGILLPPVKKAGFFDTVARFGPLPRKSFSMGHSGEKRFYLECRKII